VAENVAALRGGRSGLKRLGLFASPRCGHLPVGEAEAPEAPSPPRTVALALPALREALAMASVDDAGLALGTTVGGMPESEVALAEVLQGRAADPGVWSRHACGSTTRALAEACGLRGPLLTISTACSSGAEAIATAATLVATGEAPRMVAGGVDALCRLTLNGFASLLVVDPDGCRPFDARRAGMSLGEGAAFLVLEAEESARARGATCHAELAGHAMTTDAYHVTSPHPSGDGMVRAMRAALAAGGGAPGDVAYVNAHGTGTAQNDRIEAQALRTVFGDGRVLVSSTKSMIGHTMAAAGSLEALTTVLAITHELVPPTVHLASPDPDVPFDCVAAAAREASLPAAISNSFGFGGQNVTLLFRRAC
jgi:3-oxoacyl-(acyl-carrier-protein) synthase